MLILDGRRLDTKFNILDPTFSCPAHAISDLHIVADFDDIEAIRRLAACSDVVTYEFEHISVEALKAVEADGIPVYPSSRTLELIQDKYVQKDWMRRNGIPIPEFTNIDSLEELALAGKRFGYPFILKTRRGGYDGKGNYVIESPEDIEEAYEALGSGERGLMAEEWIDFAREVSVLACRSTRGEASVFPVAANVHRNNILDETTVPADISPEATARAMEIARRCVESFEACGMMCVELFIGKNDRVLVNELAPRPHNSGHYTIEACVTSQYEQHVRAIIGYPLGSPALIRPAAMKNIIGDHEGHAFVHGIEKAYACPEVKVHIYGKTDVRSGRKMGHVTATADTVEEALARVREAHRQIYFTDGETELERIIPS